MIKKNSFFLFLFFSLIFSSCVSPTNQKFSSTLSSSSTSSSLENSLSVTIVGLASGNLLPISSNQGELVLAITDDTYTFSYEYEDGESYYITILDQPTGQTCSALISSGYFAARDVSLLVVCTSNSNTVGGTLSGLSGSLILQQGVELKTVSSNGAFIMSNSVLYGDAYAVTVYSQPTGQNCLISNGTGTMGLSAVTNIAISCSTNSYTIGGTVSGLSGMVTVQNSLNSETKTLSSNGAYSLSNTVAHNATYNLSITSQPTGQTCILDNSSATVSGANVTNIDITCATSYTIGGVVTGLATGGSFVLTNNGDDNKTVSNNGVYQFATGLYDTEIYFVEVDTQPIGQECVVIDDDTDDTGIVNAANITTVDVSCSSYDYSVGGTVTGLNSGGSVVLQNNSTDDETVNSNGSFTFNTELFQTESYTVTVQTQPTGQTCVITDATGSINGANITGVTVTCQNNSYDVTVDVLGTLTGTVVLTNNGTNDLSISASLASYSFTTQIEHDEDYLVAVKTQPTNEKCTLAGETGTINGAGVNVTLTCGTSYSVGGTLTGLATNGTLAIADNTTDTLSLTSNGVYTFSSKLLNAEAYEVSLVTQPTGQACAFVGGSSGVIAAANETSIDILCISNSYTLSGNITGLSGQTIQLINNANSETLSTAVDGAFTFPTSVLYDSSYDVEVDIQPTGRECLVSNGSATHDEASNVTNINVSCDAARYSISANVGANSGLVGTVQIRNNSSDSLTITSPGTYTFATEIAHNGAYSVTIYSEPTGQSCEVLNGSGNATQDIVDVTVDCYLDVSSNYSVATKWNDYVRSTMTTVLCDGLGSETDYGHCLHGGEVKKIVTPYVNCDDLSMSDNLAVFDWECSDTTGTAIFTSSLAAGKGLRDLIDVGPIWKDTYVTLTDGTTDVLVSKESNDWWSNDLDATEAGTTGVLSNPWTIYIVTGDSPSGGFIITGDNVSLITMSGVTSNSTVAADNVNASGDTGGVDDRQALIAASAQKFLWIEGSFEGTTDDHLVYFWNTKFSRIHNFYGGEGRYGIYFYSSDYNTLVGSRLSKFTADVLNFYDSDRNYIYGGQFSDGQGKGVFLNNSDYNRIDTVTSFNNSDDGLSLSYSDYNVGTFIVSSNNSDDGINLASSGENKLFALTVGNNSDDGINLDNSSDHNILNNMIVFNNGDDGITLESQSKYNFLGQMIVRDNSGTQVNLNNSSYNKFAGNGKFSNVTTYCAVSGGTEPGINSTNCEGNDRSLNQLNLLSVSNLSSTFKGEDSANTTRASLDFKDSSSDFGVWLPYTVASFPAGANRGLCLVGSDCIYFDYQLDLADLRSLNLSGDGQSENDQFVSGSSCPSEVSGTQYFSKQSTPSYLLFMKNSVEILSDYNVGDNDGLCEANESCLYMPNFGSYQGSGTTSSCTFSPYGVFSNITIYSYENNGE